MRGSGGTVDAWKCLYFFNGSRFGSVMNTEIDPIHPGPGQRRSLLLINRRTVKKEHQRQNVVENTFMVWRLFRCSGGM